MSVEDRMYDYVLTMGGVPPSVKKVIELDQQIGDKFKFRPEFDASITRRWLGLDGPPIGKLPDVEFLRLADLLRRAGQISDQELASLGMVARPVLTLLERIRSHDAF